MTREHKLALILGFSILLLVGVLVGDHFSKARTTRAPGDVASASPGVLVEPERVPPTPRLQMAQAPTGGGVPIQREDILPVPAPTSPGNSVPGPELSPAGQRLVRDLTMGGPVAPPAVSIIRDSGVEPSPAGGSPASASAGAPGGNAPAAPEGGSSRPSGLPVSAEPTLSHPVTAQDSLYRLAKKYYDDGNLWEKLAEFNKGRIRGRDGLSVGVTLLIPPKAVLLGKAAASTNSPITSGTGRGPTGGSAPSGPSAGGSSPAPVSVPPQAGTSEYVVQSGDTLSTISLKTLGTSKRWTEIRDLNKSVIPADGRLKIGMKLKIPARAAR